MTVIIRDEFTDTNGVHLHDHTISPTNVPSTSWTSTDAEVINANTLDVPNGSGNILSCDAEVANHKITCYITLDQWGCTNGVVGRATDSNYCWQARLDLAASEHLQIFEANNPSYTVRASGANNIGDFTSATLTMECNGGVISASYNSGTDPISYNSTLFQTNTLVGIYYNAGSNTSFDNFQVENYVTESASVSPSISQSFSLSPSISPSYSVSPSISPSYSISSGDLQNGLVHCWRFNAGSGYTVDDTGSDPDDITLPNSITWFTDGTWGNGVRFANAGSGSDTAKVDISALSGPATYFAFFRQPTIGGTNNQWVGTTWGIPGQDYNYHFGVGISSNGGGDAGIWTGSQEAHHAVTNLTTDPHRYLTIIPTGNTVWNTYVDDNINTGPAGATQFDWANSTRVSIGGADWDTYQDNREFYIVAIWNRALSSEEISLLMQNPYIIFSGESASISQSFSLSLSSSVSPSLSASLSESESVSPSISPSFSLSQSFSISPSFSVSPSISPSTPAGNTYYLDYASGVDSAGQDGSTIEPWKTLSYALGRMSNNDTLLVRGDTTNSEIYIAPNASTALTGITIRNDTGHTPLMTGSVAYDSWSKTAGRTNVYETTYTTEGVTRVWNEDILLTSVASVAACDGQTNSYYFDDTGNLLYVNIGGSSPTRIYVYYFIQRIITFTGTNCTWDGIDIKWTAGYCIRSQATNTTIQNTDITQISTEYNTTPIVELESTGFLINNITLTHLNNLLGVGIAAIATAGGTVQNSTINNCYINIQVLGGTYIVDNCNINNSSNTGISSYAATSTVTITVRNSTFINNRRGIAYGGTNATTNSTEHHNTLYVTSTYNNSDTFAEALCYHNHGTSNCYHNVMYNFDTGIGNITRGRAVWIAPLPADVSFTLHAKNNAILNADAGWYYASGTVTYDIDYTSFYNVTNNYLDIAAGDQGSNDQTGNPLFVNAPEYNFNLQGGSPLINTGVVVTGINDGYFGAAPDIGRYEFTIIIGSAVWGHVTGVAEINVRTFTNNWTGTGTITGSGDNERLELNATEYMESEVINTGIKTTRLRRNVYQAGDTVNIRYRHGTSEANCLADTWKDYTTPFQSLGYVQIRVESSL